MFESMLLDTKQYNNLNFFQCCTVILGILLTLCFLNWLYELMVFRQYSWKKEFPIVPPALPSTIPLFSNTFSFVFQQRSFMQNAGSLLGAYLPVRVRLLLGDIYIVRGRENISTLWKESTNSTSTELHGFFFDRIFGMPQRATALYAKDDSGFTTKPHPKSQVDTNNRIDHITHQVLKEFLLSPKSVELAPRYAARISSRFAKLEIENTWLELPDLLDLFQIEMTTSNIEVMYGPTIFRCNPQFCKDFWIFSRHLYGFYKPFPKWTIPLAYASRSRLLSAVKMWQNTMQQAGNDAKTDGNDPLGTYWGPNEIRRWYKKFVDMDGFGEDAVASLYLGIIWASNYNITPSVFWMILEIYRSPGTLAAIRLSLANESAKSSIPDGQGNNVTLNLSKLPLLQSVFAETLRLRVQAYITRRFPHKSVVLDDKWVIPQNKICLASTHPAHQDETVWNTKDGMYPLDTFWADRFLIYPNDPHSGPLNPTQRANWESTKTQKPSSERIDIDIDGAQSDNAPMFSLDGLGSSWIPFGGGPRACPGRYLAKQQVLSTVVAFINQFDIEIIANERAWEMDEQSYGPGVQLPIDKVPFRIRRRNA